MTTLMVDTISTFFDEVRDHGLPAALLLNSVFLKAKPVITRVRTHVLPSSKPAEEALAIRTSYKDSFNMIAVTAAISAQISITALSLSYIEEVHWTATAAFVSSLIDGLFAIYFSCLLQLKLGSLHQGEDVLSWLKHTKHTHGQNVTGITIPSFSAAMMLVAPAQLLNWSLASFIIGIGIYYGQIFSAGIGMLSGQNANLAVLLVYVLATINAAAEYFLPHLGKLLEGHKSELTDIQLKEWFRRNVHHGSLTSNVPVDLGGTTTAIKDQGDENQLYNSTSTPIVDQCSTSSIEALTKVFQESIILQEANLKAMRDLIKLLAQSKQLDTHGQVTHAEGERSSKR